MGKEMIGTLDLEELKTQDNLTEDQMAAIALSVLDEEKPKSEDTEEPKSEDSEDGTPKKEEDPKEDTTKDSEEPEAKKEEEVEPKKAEEDKAKQEEEAKKQEEDKKKAFEDEVVAYAKESELSVEEARSDLESIGKIQEKYKNDPKQLAKANLHLQRLYTKSAEEAKAAKEAKPSEPPQPLTYDNIIKAIDEGKINVSGKPGTREDIVAAYREQEPDLTENVDDDAVLKLAAKAIKDNIEANHRNSIAKLATDAKERRAKLISELSETDKQYLPEIKPVLDLQPDAVVMNEKFSLSDFVLWAKGKKYDAGLKEAEEKGYKRGLEEAKILGEKKPASEASGKPKGSPKKSLSEADKERALNMYDGLDMTEEQKYEAYIEFIEETNKKK